MRIRVLVLLAACVLLLAHLQATHDQHAHCVDVHLVGDAALVDAEALCAKQRPAGMQARAQAHRWRSGQGA